MPFKSKAQPRKFAQLLVEGKIKKRLGSLRRAHAWGVAAHHIGTLVMIGAVGWGGWWLAKRRPRHVG